MNERTTPTSDDVLTHLVRAAQQPATADEVAGISALADRFVADVTAAPATVAARGRGLDMSRVSRRTVGAVAAALLVAGTAAAASGGVLPGPLDFGDEVAVTEDTTPTDETTVDGSVPSEDTTPVEDTVVEDTTVEDTVVEALPGDEYLAMLPEAHGLCTAWSNGAPKKLNPAFTKLQNAADEAGVSLEEFCSEVELAHDDTDEADETDDTTETTLEGETDEADETEEADEAEGDSPSVTAPGRAKQG